MPTEHEFLEKVEKIIENFGAIYRHLAFDEMGVHAIVKFIEDFSGQPQSFSLDDPVVQKGKSTCHHLIQEMERTFSELQTLSPPELWSTFHASLLQSIQFQLDGYKEMAKAFEDRNIIHIAAGQKLVNKGLGLLEAGTRQAKK